MRGANQQKRRARWRPAWLILPALLAATLLPWNAPAQTNAAPIRRRPLPVPETARTGLPDALGPERWARVEQVVDRALAWLATQQQPDGSFPSMRGGAAANGQLTQGFNQGGQLIITGQGGIVYTGQPAVTSLAVMAFLSRGHQPGIGPYGSNINRGIEYVLKQQKPDGLFSCLTPELQHVDMGASHTATYNHAITGLMLTEAYGSTSGEQSARIKAAIERAISRTRRLQVDPVKTEPADTGGWRYLYPPMVVPSDSDLSATGWHLMFLRSAKNAEFSIPDEVVKSAMEYVQRCYDETTGEFRYGLFGHDRYVGRGMTGAGILCLSLGGLHETEMARQAGAWLLAHPFGRYGETIGWGDRFHYSAYYCSQAMAQLGGNYWVGFFPSLVNALVEGQQPNGSWRSEVGASGQDAVFGPVYATAMSVLALTPPYQLLPIYQR